MSSGQRRKLQAKRNTGTARVDTAPFVWASDRYTQCGQDEDGVSPPCSRDLHAYGGLVTQLNVDRGSAAADRTGTESGHVSRPRKSEVPCDRSQDGRVQLTKPQQPAQQPDQFAWPFSWPRNRQPAREILQQPAAGKHLEHALLQPNKPPAAQHNHQKRMQPAATVAAATEPAGGAAAAFCATAAAAAQVTVGWLYSTASPVLAQLLGLQPDITAAQSAGQLQQRQQVSGPPSLQHAPPPQQQQLAGHGAAAAGGGGLLATLHETSESAAAVYTETLKPAGELLWQLVLGTSGLLAAVVVYVLLPLLRGSIRASRYLLLRLNKLLMPCRQRLQQIWSSRMDAPSAAETAPAGTSPAAADEDAMQGEAGPGSAVPDALSPAVASPPADGSPSLHAPTDQHQQNLLQFAQQHLATTCRQQQGFLLDLQQLSGSSSSYTDDSSQLSWLRTADKLSPDAGFGSCAYRAVLVHVPVALLLYRIATPQDAELFAQSLHSLNGVRETSLLPCQGATFALVPAECCPPGVDAVVIPRSVQPTAGCVPAQQQPQQPVGVVVAFVVAVQLIQQSSGLRASLHEAALPDRQQQQQQRNSVTPSSADAPVAGGGSSRHSTSTVYSAGRIGGSSSSTHTAGLQCWSNRLQLAPEVAAAVHQLYTAVPAAGTNSTWLNGVTGEQLAAALVVDQAAHRMQVKLNTAVLLIGALQRDHARDSRHHHPAANTGLLAATGDVLMLLATAEPHGARSSSSSSSHPTTVDQVQCVIRARLSAEGVASDDEVAHATDQLAELVVALWQQSSPQQQQSGEQQQQQVLEQQTASRHTTSSRAAAVGLSQRTSWLGWVLGRLSSKTSEVEQSGTSSQHESLAPNSSSRPATNNATEQAETIHDAGTAALAAANQSDRASVGQVDNADQTLNFDWISGSLQQVADNAAAWQAQQLERQQALAAAAAAAEAAARRSRASEPPAWFICPITSSIMVDPVVAADGHTYERAVISHWLQVARVPRSPMTNQVMQPTLVPNHVIRSAIMEWKQQHMG